MILFIKRCIAKIKWRVDNFIINWKMRKATNIFNAYWRDYITQLKIQQAMEEFNDRMNEVLEECDMKEKMKIEESK